MDDEQVSKLESLLERHALADNDPTVGNFYLAWGSFIVGGMVLFRTIFPFEVFWVTWILIGILTQYAAVALIKKPGGSQTWRSALVSAIWIPGLAVMPLIIFVFPFVLKLYNSDYIFVVISLWLSIISYAAGLASRRLSLQIGSLAFLIAAPCFYFFPAYTSWIFAGKIFGGNILPGFICRYEKVS